jgi:hypothetical protein
MTLILTITLGLVFDSHHPDIFQKRVIDDILCESEKNSANVLVSEATFTIADRRENVCWLVGGVYDQYLCQFFRGVLYYALAFVKQYTKKQKYYVSKNFTLRSYKTESGKQYRKILLDDFAISRHPRKRGHSSDDELQYSSEEEEDEDSSEEEEVEEVEEEEKKDEVNTTLLITLGADNGTTTRVIRPLSFNRITQVVASGMTLSEEDQLEEITQHVMRLMDLNQLDNLSGWLTNLINTRRERARTAQAAVNTQAVQAQERSTNFFFRHSFSSSEDDEGEDE